MNIPRKKFLLFLALPWVAVGCHKSDKLAESSTFKTPSGLVVLQVKWAPGEKVEQNLEVRMGMEITVPGQPNPILQDVSLGEDFALSVLPPSPDAGHELEMEFHGLRVSGDQSGATNFNFDSSKQTAASAADPLAKALGKVIGAKVQVYLDASNGVERVEGVDQLLQGAGSDPNNSTAQALQNLFSKDTLKQYVNYSKFLPDHPVQPGDSWPVHYEAEAATIGKMSLDYVVSFKAWELHGPRNCARLEFTGTMKSEGDSPVNSAYKLNSFTGDSSGTSWFDPELGITVETSMNLNMQLALTVPAGKNTMVVSDQITEAVSSKLVSLR